MTNHAPAAPFRRYLIVSPVKDEAPHVERTLRSVAGQTVRPMRWIIVDDGSSDGTRAMLHRFAQQHAWVEIVERRKTGPRQPGSAVVHAFYEGFEHARDESFDYLVKLDCDVELPPDYFEALMSRCELDPRLGIASGVYEEEGADGWKAVDMPPYHTAGASKFMRAQCFAEIGGFVRERGWDTVDELRAQTRGWKTAHFPELRFRHLKREGSGIGSMRTHAMHGDVYYLTGGGLPFLLLKTLHRMAAGSPPLFGGLALLFGYLRSWASGRQRLVDAAEARHYRRLLNARLLRWPAARRRGRSMPSVRSS
jgi:glycosyltransferase involved in cell wall biosynthesis